MFELSLKYEILPLHLLHAARYAAWRTCCSLHPRALLWRHWQKYSPQIPRIASLGKHLKVRLYPHDVIGKNIFIFGLFEKAECRFVTRFLQPGMIFLDLGANLGQYTLLAARRIGPAGQVHSFEPSTRMFAELQFNVALNDLASCCVLNHAAVSDRPGHGRLALYKPGYEVFGTLGDQERHSHALIGYETIPILTLDEYVEQKQLERVDLIKMDIEGAELPALQGATKLLSCPHAPALVLEFSDANSVGFGYHSLETWDYLTQFGYQLYRFDRRGKIGRLAPRPANFAQSQNLVALKSSPNT